MTVDSETNKALDLEEKLAIKFDGRPYIYDITIDQYRLVTQKDVDKLQDFVQTFGSVIYEMQKAQKRWEAILAEAN
jgi:hypothetical protein